MTIDTMSIIQCTVNTIERFILVITVCNDVENIMCIL